MNPQESQVAAGESVHSATTGLRAATLVCRDRGMSDTSLWRLRRDGKIKWADINGKVYVDLASLAEFDERARRGEFARGPRGAAAQSAAKKRAEKRGQP